MLTLVRKFVLQYDDLMRVRRMGYAWHEYLGPLE